jgi:hypothetical protein
VTNLRLTAINCDYLHQMSSPTFEHLFKMSKAFNKAFKSNPTIQWLDLISGKKFPVALMKKIEEFLPKEETSEERMLRKVLKHELKYTDGRIMGDDYGTLCRLHDNHQEYRWTVYALTTHIVEHILSGRFNQDINLRPGGIHRSIMIASIQQMENCMKARLIKVSEMHPVYLRQLFNTRGEFDELMMVPQRLKNHLKESVSLPDFFARRARALGLRNKSSNNIEKKEPTTPCERAYHLIQTHFYNKDVAPDAMLYNMWYAYDRRRCKYVETTSMYCLRQTIEGNEIPSEDLEDQCTLFVGWCKSYRFDKRENKTARKNQDVEQCIELICSAFRARDRGTSTSTSISTSTNSNTSSSSSSVSDSPRSGFDLGSNPGSLDDAIARARENHLAREKERKEKEESAKKLKLAQERQKAKELKMTQQSLNGKKGKK